MPRHDRLPINWLVVGILAGFTAIQLTIGLYWLAHAADLPARSDAIARLYRFYAAADHGFFDRIGQAELGSGALGVFLMPALEVLLIAALLRRWTLQAPLQIAVGSSVAYSVLFGWWQGLLGGFPGMDEKTAGHFALYFGANLPWLVGSLYVARDGMCAAMAVLRREPAVKRKGADDPVPSFHDACNLRQKARAAGLSPDHWYPVAKNRRLAQERVIGVSFQGESIAVYRSADGRLHAMADRCRHRGIPLSRGIVKNCALVCPYHGWSYGEDGRLTGVAHELFGRELPSIGVKTYPVCERYGLIWLFPGDPARAAAMALPEIPEIEGRDPHPFVLLESQWNAHFTIVLENFSDLTHAHLHRRHKPFVDPILIRHALGHGEVSCEYRTTLVQGPIVRRMLDRGSDMEILALRFAYPYLLSNTGDRIKTWAFVTPLDQNTTRIFFLMFTKTLRIPFTRMHFPKRLIGTGVALMVRALVAPILRQDAEAVEWEQRAYGRSPRATMVEFNPLVADFRQLVVRKWQEHLDAGRPAGDPDAASTPEAGEAVA